MEKIRNDSVEKRNLLLCCLLAFSTYRSPRWSARRARSVSPGPGGREPPRPADEVCPSAAPFLDSVCPVAELPPNLLKLRILFEKRDRFLVPGNSAVRKVLLILFRNLINSLVMGKKRVVTLPLISRWCCLLCKQERSIILEGRPSIQIRHCEAPWWHHDRDWGWLQRTDWPYLEH